VGTFAFASDGQQITGQAALIQQEARVYQLVGFATSQAWPKHKPALESSIRSFRPLTDPVALAAKPYTIEIETNDAQPDTRLEPGRLIKRVVGGPGND
jgi:predicted Zn-dependent protease